MSRHFSCALLLLAAGCFAACLGSSLAYSSKDDDISSRLCSDSFTVVETDTVDVLPPGQSDYMNGTTYIFRNTLTLPSAPAAAGYGGKKDVVVGYTFGVCSIFIIVEAQQSTPYYHGGNKGQGSKQQKQQQYGSSSSSSSFSIEYCKTSYVFDKLGGSTIEAQGPYPDIQDNVFKNAVVGGTAAFEGASGQVVVKVLQVGSVWQHTFYLKDTPHCNKDNSSYKY